MQQIQNDLWAQVKANLGQRNTNNKLLQLSLEPVRLVKSELIDGVMVFHFAVPSKYYYFKFSENLSGIVEEIAGIYKNPFNVQVGIDESLACDLKPEINEKSQGIGNTIHNELFEKIGGNQGSNYNTTSAQKPKQDEYLNPEYTFQTFVVGKNNEFAHAATYNIAQNPGGNYNPLFICGPVGMGKTHLLIAAGNLIKENNPGYRIVYVSIDRYINECVAALRHGQMDKFRQKYRDGLDVLLVDDIQGLRRGESVQEEFFNTINELFDKKKQVIVASDRVPREILGLEDRIRSRLEWGLIANIQMPDLETRVAILRYKAERLGLRLSEDVINYIARISKTSIRELEGNLNRVKMFAELQGISIDQEFTKKALAIQEYENTATIEDIQKMVADYYKVKMTDLKGSSRVKTIVVPRQVAMYLIEKHLGKSLTDIGRSFGNKDHTTVINARERIKDLLSINADLKKDIDELTAKIHNVNGL